MKQFNKYIIEKLRINPNPESTNVTLYEQGYGFTTVNSVYTDIYMADDFLQSDLDIVKLAALHENVPFKQENRVVVYDKPFQALKRRKYCQAIGNIILSENSFDDAILAIQSILRKNATCKFDISKSGKYVVFKILDSFKIAAIVMTFTKL